MATYLELAGLSQDPDLIAKLTAAVAVAAEAIRNETPANPARRAWANAALLNPEGKARQLIWLLLAANAGLTVAQIEGASDAVLQTAVNDALSLLAE